MFGQSLLSAFGSAACTTDTDQLFGTDVQTTSVATYQLNASPVTSIPSNTYPGTANNITYTTGKFGDAAVFNGSNADIDVSSSAINTTSPYTISMWLNIVDVTQYKGIFANVTSSYLTNQIAFVLNNGKISIYSVVSNGNTTLDAITATPQSAITNNTWFNLVIIADRSLANKAKVFFNNVEGSYVYQSGVAGTASYSNIKIGLADGAGRYFNGYMDQIRFFNSSLPQPAITALYNETTTTAQSASIDYVDANPNSIAYYKMSDATDQLGNYNGTATNVNFNTEGKFGFAGAFNGSNADIDLPSNIDSTTMSISFWIYIDSIVTGNEVVIELENGYGVWFLANAGGKLGMQSSNANSAHTLSNSQLSAGSWHHVAAVWNSGSRTFYIDNTVQSGGSVTDYLTCNENTIGSRRSGEFFDGKIDQIRIYNSALSAANVSTLYKEVECEPAAINALANFNTVLYAGNASTNQISTVGFAPGFTWIKARNTTTSPEAHDVVRGEPSRLWTDNNYAASTAYNGFVKLTSNGFDLNNVGSGGNVNRNYNYVAWNWKAALANLSTEFNSNRQGQITLPSSITTPWNTSSEFGISCWINPSTWGSSQQTQAFSFNGPNSGNIGFDKEPSGNFRCFVTTSGGSFVGVNSSNNLSATNKWYHIVWTGSASAGVKLYVDGVNTGSASWDGTYLNNTGTNSIGVSPQSLRGNIAQFRVYSSYLTSSEVSDLYTEPAASNNTLNYPAGAGCIAAYPLQTDAVDLSGNYSGASSNVTFGQPGYLTGNTNGTIPSVVAANVEAGFSIVKWVGTRPSSGTIGHGLGLTPKMIIIKNLSITSDWTVYAESEGATKHGILDTSAAWGSNAGAFNNTSPTSNVFTVGSDAYTNGTGNNIIAYCFADIAGYSKVGSYVGNDTTNTLYVGFKPRFLLIKCASNGGTNKDWVMIDSTMDPSIPITKRLEANTSDAEATDTINITMNSDGWTMPNGTSTASINQIGFSYIFLAIA